MGDLLIDAYYRTASETAHEAGLGIEAEAGGPGPPVHQVPVDALKALGSIDQMWGEFWPWRLTNDPLWVVKETACAAHIYGRKMVNMESFTGFQHWTAGPFDLKFAADRAFAEGMNHVVWHTSSHQPPEAGMPGWVYGAGTHLTPNLVWWPMAGAFLDYLARCSYLLEQGLFVADVCYYSGDQGYNFVPPKHVDPSLGFGYDYDVINPEVLLSRMRVVDGRLTLPDGMHYEALVLPERADIDPGVLRKLAELVRDGATVVGPKPERANGLADREARDQQVQRIADVLWGPCDGASIFEHRFGKGTVVWGRSLRSILVKRGVGPDIKLLSGADERDLDFIHRRTSGADLYFVRNKSPRAQTVEVEFRVRNRRPEIWRPGSGEIFAQPVYQEAPAGVRVPLTLAAFGSAFVVFRDASPRVHLTKADAALMLRQMAPGTVDVTAETNGAYVIHTSTGAELNIDFDSVPRGKTIDGPWNVHFPPGWDVPESVTFDTLSSWTDQKLDGIRFFSGTARYDTTFVVPPAWMEEGVHVDLDLGALWAVAKVVINGQDLGVVWKPPYRFDITRALKPGENRLEVPVANTWANRLVGDASRPVEERRTRTNITRSGGKLWKDVPLHESGLLGLVRLIPRQTKTVTLSQ